MWPLAVPHSSWWIALPVAPAGSVADVAPAGTAARAPCPLVPRGRTPPRKSAMGAACTGVLSRRCHYVTQCAARPSSILTILSLTAKYGRPYSPRHVRPPSAIREWHLADSSAGRRRPTSRCGWSARTACR